MVTAIAAWMLDPVACAGMATIGAPCVSASALLDLHHLLIDAVSAISQGDPNIVQEEQHAEFARAGAAGDEPRQLSMALDSAGFGTTRPSAGRCSPGWPACYWRPPGSRCRVSEALITRSGRVDG